MAKVAVLSIRLDPALKAAVDAAARKDSRSTAQWVALALEKAVAEAEKAG